MFPCPQLRPDVAEKVKEWTDDAVRRGAETTGETGDCMLPAASFTPVTPLTRFIDAPSAGRHLESEAPDLPPK